jgi:hypothetical protein
MIIGHTFQPVCQQKNSNFPQKKEEHIFCVLLKAVIS